MQGKRKTTITYTNGHCAFGNGCMQNIMYTYGGPWQAADGTRIHACTLTCACKCWARGKTQRARTADGMTHRWLLEVFTNYADSRRIPPEYRAVIIKHCRVTENWSPTLNYQIKNKLMTHSRRNNFTESSLT